MFWILFEKGNNLNRCLLPFKKKHFLQVEDRKDSDDEKSDRNRPWWKKRFVSAIPKGDAVNIFHELKNDLLSIEIDLLLLFCLLLLKKTVNVISGDRKYQTLKSRRFIMWGNGTMMHVVYRCFS